MVVYPFDSIHINGRTVNLQEIKTETVLSNTSFELSTFSFIKDWLNGTDHFTINTSGSTGTPKEIIITRGQMIASAQLTEEALQLKSGFNALVCLDTQYIAGKMMIVRCFITGMKIIAVNPSANPLKEIFPEQKIDFAAFVPYQLQEIISSEVAFRLNVIQTAIVGGAALDNLTRELLQQFRCHFYATYGMTETMSHIALQKLNGQNASEFFQTLTGIDIKTDDRDCLVIKSRHLPEEVHTNDIVEIKSATAFNVIGRYDNVINSGGIKVSPEKLEIEVGKIFKDINIQPIFFIAGLPDKKLGQKIVLLVEGEKLTDSIIGKIYSMFKHYLPLYEIPKEILFKKKFFYTQTGKINRLTTIEFVEK